MKSIFVGIIAAQLVFSLCCLNGISPTAVENAQAIPPTPSDNKEYVWFGSIRVGQDGKEFEKEFILSNSYHEELNDTNEIGYQVDVDVISSAGLLMTGKATKRSDVTWYFDTSTAQIEDNALEKMRLCDGTSDEKRSNPNQLLDCYVFAVSPQNNKVKAQKPQKVSLLDKNIYSDLPASVKKILDQTFSEKSYNRKYKKTVSESNGDLGVDRDGDGKIDLIGLSAVCTPGKYPEGNLCYLMLVLKENRWILVGS